MVKQIKKSEARKIYWQKISKEERSQKMRELVRKRYAKMTKEQKSEHGKKLVQFRWSKKLSTS